MDSSQHNSPRGANIRVRLALLCTVLLTGCFQDDGARELRQREARVNQEQIEASDELSTTFQALPVLGRFDRDYQMREFCNATNAWGSLKSPHVVWQAPWLLKSLPSAVQDSDIAKRLTRFEMTAAESEYLWQCKLCKQIGHWVIQRPYRDSLFVPWLEETKKKLPEEAANQLEIALKLFDWTVRNIALEGQANDIETAPIDPSSPSNDNQLGYRTLPWQTILFGHGDSVQRGRVFTQLLFQQGLSAFYIAIPSDDPAKKGQRSLWAIGVPIHDAIYLFEPRFGLPLPLADEAAVSTWAQAKSDPSVLRRAKLPGRFDYPTTANDLSRAIVLLDIEPFAMGLAMRILEDSLAGENRIRLIEDVDKLQARLTAIAPELTIELWSMPWLAQIFNQMIRQQVKDRTPFGITYQVERSAYLYETVLWDARLSHFRGEFETTLDINGAPNRYMSSRIDEASLEKLPYDVETQYSLQIVRLPNEKQEEFQFRIHQMQQSFRFTKLDSHFFLGSLQFDIGNWNASIDWMDERLLQIAGTEKWQPHAKYILARAFEQKANVGSANEKSAKNSEESSSARAQALQWLKCENVPQEAGNRIRARLLEKKPE
jgi:hypothetical protein